MGPIDYTMNIANPITMALQGFQIGQQMRAQRQAEEQAIAQKELAQRKAEAMASLMGPGKTFADYQRVMQMFPDEAKGLIDQWNALDKVKQSTFFNAGGEAYALLQPGPDGTIDGTRALDKLESYATASDNSGDKDTAQKLRDMANYIKTNPAAGKATIGSVLAVVDGERFKNVSGAELGPIDTAAVKNLIAEGLKPGTPEFQTAMRQEREKVTVTLPGGGFFSGSPDKLREILGEVPAGAQRGSLPRVTDKKSYDAVPPGASYTDPNGIVRVKPGAKGGPASSAPGGFRAGS